MFGLLYQKSTAILPKTKNVLGYFTGNAPSSAEGKQKRRVSAATQAKLERKQQQQIIQQQDKRHKKRERKTANKENKRSRSLESAQGQFE